MTRQRRVIALAGLSGSGKSTLIQQLKFEAEFEHLSASQLLKEWAIGKGNPTDAESLRTGDIDANQRNLIEAFVARAAAIKSDIVFDCHTVIDTPNGLQYIPSSVFAAMGITDVAFLTVDPEILVERRVKDISRERPQRSALELAHHHREAITATELIARTIGASFTDLAGDAREGLLALLERRPPSSR